MDIWQWVSSSPYTIKEMEIIQYLGEYRSRDNISLFKIHSPIFGYLGYFFHCWLHWSFFLHGRFFSFFLLLLHFRYSGCIECLWETKERVTFSSLVPWELFHPNLLPHFQSRAYVREGVLFPPFCSLSFALFFSCPLSKAWWWGKWCPITLHFCPSHFLPFIFLSFLLFGFPRMAFANGKERGIEACFKAYLVEETILVYQLWTNFERNSVELIDIFRI